MTDKELLELAAKAAGIDGRYNSIAKEFYLADNFMFADDPDRRWWNPLTDDGDALRLAVKLYKYDAFKITDIFDAQFGAYDPYAATRRAIVRAAAEIGKEKS